jgi:hypothetical protein
VFLRQTDPRLLLSLERERRFIGVAAMGGVNTIEDGTTIPLQAEERADAIHDLQDSKRPSGEGRWGGQ